MGLYDKKLRNQKREWNKAIRESKKSVFSFLLPRQLKIPKLPKKPPKL